MTITTVAQASALSDADLNALSGVELVAVYNLLTEKDEVKRFATRADGVRRVKTLVSAARLQLSTVAGDATERTPPKGQLKAVNGHAVTSGASPTPRVASTQIVGNRATKGGTIRLLVKTNPKRPGSAAFSRFTHYRDGMSVAEYISTGGTRLDIRYDTAHGFIRVEN